MLYAHLIYSYYTSRDLFMNRTKQILFSFVTGGLLFVAPLQSFAVGSQENAEYKSAPQHDPDYQYKGKLYREYSMVIEELKQEIKELKKQVEQINKKLQQIHKNTEMKQHQKMQHTDKVEQ